MEENKLFELIGNQGLILSYIMQKLSMVNYIMDGYDQNKPVLMNNRFLHFTAHIYYRISIIELSALFIRNMERNRFNLHIYYKQPWVKEYLDEDAIQQIKDWLDKVSDKVKKIEILRHNELAHFSFRDGPSISHDFDYLQMINELQEVATKILKYVGGNNFGFDFKNNLNLRILEGMVQDLIKAKG